jgi:DNA-binding CsgD family transcriptional regulator/PAS domain-containing protein
VLDDEKVSRLVGEIYDATLDAALWPRVLEQAAGFVRGSGASLYAKDVVNKTGNVAYRFGLDPKYEQLYLEKYIKLDPTALGYFMAELEEPVCTADVMPYDEFLATRFYKEWGRPQHLVDTVHAMLEKSLTSAAAFVVFRHERDGIVDDETRRRMRLIIPHIRRAVLIGRILDLKNTEAAGLADAFDGIAAGMFLIGSDGHIVHANLAAQAMLDRRDVVRARGGRLTAVDPQTDQSLTEVFGASGNSDGAIGTKGIALPLFASNLERYVAHVLPLTSGARRRAGVNYSAAAMLLVHKAALEGPSPPEAIAKAYKLTPTEVRVLLGLVEIGGIPEVAEALGIAETTVKTHVGGLYEKTGARRHADLVKIVAGFYRPLVGSRVSAKQT